MWRMLEGVDKVCLKGLWAYALQVWGTSGPEWVFCCNRVYTRVAGGSCAWQLEAAERLQSRLIWPMCQCVVLTGDCASVLC
jgi:hypothetical protein